MTMHSMGVFRSFAALAALLLAAPAAWAQAEPTPEETQPQPPPTDAPPAPPADAPPAEEKKEEKKEGEQPPPTTPPPPTTAAPGTAPAAQPAPAPAAGGTGLTWNAQADTGTKGTQQPGGEAKPKKLPWRGTSLGWDHSATTETVGIGRDTQSRNPTYEMSFALQPRYYLWESTEGPDQSISLRGRLDLVREFTNSDSTTKEGEWTFSDLSLFPQYSRNLYKQGEDVSTDAALRLPVLTFPTSKVSANNGTVLGLGTMVIGSQKVPVLGSESDTLKNFTLTGRLGYNHTFTQATTPTNDDLGRVRMGPDGRSLPGDQLSGAAFAQHNATIDLIGALQVHEKVVWTNWFSWRPAWKYTFQEDQEVEIATGTATVESNEDPDNFAVVTLFNTEVAVEVVPEFEIDVGYANLTLQRGPDGENRNIFYSPDARVYITFVAHLDEIYKTATNYDAQKTAKAPAPRQVAKNKPRTQTK